MNLYFVVSPDGSYSHVVLAATGEKAAWVYNQKTHKIAKEVKRVKQGHYIVGMTYLFDDIS